MIEQYNKNHREWKRLIKVKTGVLMKHIEITGWSDYGVYYMYYKNKFHKLLGIEQHGYFSFRKAA